MGSEKLLFTLHGHKGVVHSVTFSPDGRTLASASSDTTVKLWAVGTGKERTTLQGHTKEVMSVVFSPDGKALASASDDYSVKLWDLATGKEQATLQGHTGFVFSIAFSPDGKNLASASSDKTIKLWDIKKTVSARTALLAPKDLNDVWSTLAGEDEAKAYQAIGTLVGVPDQTLPFVMQRLQPVPKLNPELITRLISDLDSDQFAVRQKATDELENMGESPEVALRGKMSVQLPSLEVRRRIERLLTKLKQNQLRTQRAVEVLESIGTSEAKKVLETLATGAEGARLTKEAKASLDRLKKRTVEDR